MVSKGLAWFSRQIPTEGFSDINEGRLAETEIPHSDQWIDGIGKSAGSYKPDEFNIRNVLRDRNGRGISKIIVEEIYQSGEYRLTDGIGLHNASYLDGRFIYESPTNWINANTVNRTIALRRCDATPREYNFVIRFRIDQGAAHNIKIWASPDTTLLDTVEMIRRQMVREAHLNRDEIEWLYTDNEVQIGTTAGHTIEILNAGDDFFEMMNVEEARRAGYLNNPQQMLSFPNVWNRTDLYIHASFVNNTAAGFLSRGNEFYTSPSKQYKVEYPISTFFFETSFDGYHKIPLPYENFIGELSFLIDVDNYY
jgi:hypothetical protein